MSDSPTLREFLDERHRTIMDKLDEIKDQAVLTNGRVTKAELAIAVLRWAYGIGVVHATVEHHGAARRWLAKLADQPISYTDAVSFAVMEALGCRVALTFDRHFAMAGFGTWRGES